MARPVYFLDAHDGRVVLRYDNLQAQSANGTATSNYSGAINPFKTYFSAQFNQYSIENHGNKVLTGNSAGSIIAFNLDANNVWGQPSESDVVKESVDAHYAAGMFFEYLLNVHNRSGLNGAGGPGYFTSINGTTRLDGALVRCGSLNNAYWTGNYACLGGGDGFASLAWVSIDITAHELTHGLVENTAKLVYQGESGALNESMADVFGSLVERYVRGENANTWLFGEDFLTPFTAGDALRYLATLHAAFTTNYTLDDDPDHYSERYLGTADNGGVHVNSGITNKAFHLLAKGGTLW